MPRYRDLTHALWHKYSHPVIIDARGQHEQSADSSSTRLESYTPNKVTAWLKARGLKAVALGTDGGGHTDNTAGQGTSLPSQDLGVTETIPESGVRPNVTSNKQSIAPTGLSQDKITAGAPRRKVGASAVETVDLTVDEEPSAQMESITSSTPSTIRFSNQGIEAHGLVALSKYFAAKMTALDSYIPLSVFNTQWLRQDLLQQSLRKRSVKEKLEDSYIGLTVPLEWKMTFGEWVVAFDLFITYLEYYGWKELAVKFRGHKENVFAVKRENSNWPVAFRYDLAVRTAVMTFRLPDGSVANPAIRDARIEREAIRETERLKDFIPAFKEINPYADGEIKAFMDPITGVDSRARHYGPNHSFSRPTFWS